MSVIDLNDVVIGEGGDTPPLTFRNLQTQQGQINWLMEAIMQLNDAAAPAESEGTE